MLTTKMLRVRIVKNKVLPCYLPHDDPHWLSTCEYLLELFRRSVGSTRNDIEQQTKEQFENATDQLVIQGLVKVLEDRCEFSMQSDLEPEVIRQHLFLAAAKARKACSTEGDTNEKDASLLAKPETLPRAAIFAAVAEELNTTSDILEQQLFADLRSEQRMTKFADLTPERMLHRYNVGLAQGILLRATNIEIKIKSVTPQRLRQLLRRAKFHRLLCHVANASDEAVCLSLDGPLSLFSVTQKYGLQLALFLPAVIHCSEFHLTADVRWSTKKIPKIFELAHEDGLIADQADQGVFMPEEVQMFVNLFREQIDDWDLVEQPELIPLADSYWIPDFQLVHKESGQVVMLEIFGFWRKQNITDHLERLRSNVTTPFLVAIGKELRVEEETAEEFPANVIRFRSMPLPKQIAKAANSLL